MARRHVARQQEAIRPPVVTGADVAERVDHALIEQNPVGDDEVGDQAADAGIVSLLDWPVRAFVLGVSKLLQDADELPAIGRVERRQDAFLNPAPRQPDPAQQRRSGRR